MNKEHFLEFLDYDPLTGIFFWKKVTNARLKIGSRAGYLGSNGYRYLTLNGKMYLEARVAWLIHTGNWPLNEIDHINRVKNDNRIINLREATRGQQIVNSKRKRTINIELQNFPGVMKNNKGKYYIGTKRNNKYIRIGSYDTPEEAYEIYKKFHKTYNDIDI